MTYAVPRGRRLAFALVPFLVLIAACTPGSAAGPVAAPVGGAYDEAGNPSRAGAGGAQPPAAQQPGTDQSNGSTGQYDVSRPDLLIIKTGTLSLEVAAIDDALAGASGKIAALGGYVSGSDRKGDGDQVVATVTYRIPAAQWDQVLVALRGLATKVLAEQSQTQDVTSDVLDLGARITNLQATEAALQAIMAKATKIEDVLAVQGQLTDVRGQIEQLSTQKKHLQDQAAFSTLTVAYSLKPAPAVETSQKNFDPGHEVDQASASLVDVLQAVATAGIWFGIVWLPVLFALAIVLGIVLLVLRRVLPPRRAPVMPPAEA
jgi:hypothetical protein